MNVWQMPYDIWLAYVAAVQELQDSHVGWWGVGINGHD